MHKLPDIILEYLSFVEEFYGRSNSDKQLFFRGHRNSEWELLPSVFRSENGIGFNERQLILDFKQVAVSEMEYRDKLENMLVDMQHYGIPTRLLDWSLSPLIALYFACQDDPKNSYEDGRVYALNPWGVYLSIINKISSTGAKHPELMDILKESRMLLGQNWDFQNIKQHIDNKYNYKLQREALRMPIPFVGRYMVNRIPSQKGCFLIWGDGDHQAFSKGMHFNLCEYQEYDAYLDKFDIPFEQKGNCRQWLSKMGINNFSVFPDDEGMKKDIIQTGGIFNIIK